MKAVENRRPWWVGVLAAVLLLVGVAVPARAQMGMGMDMGAFSAPINRRSLEDYAKIVKLTPDQKDAVKSLYDAYLAAHAEVQKEMTKAFQDAQEKMQESGDMKAFQKELPKAMAAIRDKNEKLEKGFYDDTKALLSNDQQANWEKIERHRRREKGLRFGFISGQAIDMVRVVDSLKIDPAAAPGLADQLERYEVDMDRAIAAFDKFSKEQEKEQAKFTEDFDMSKLAEMMPKIKSMMKDMLGIAKGMRDVNRQYARSIQPLLPEEQRPKLEAEFNRRAYPRIYRESYVSKALAAAAGFSDATADQKAQIAEMKKSYLAELEPANRKWASTTDEREDKTGGQMLEMMDMWGGAGGDPAEQKAKADGERAKEEANKAMADRKALDKRYKTKLLALLTEEQKERLPEEKKDPAGMFGMMGVPEDFGPDDENQSEK